MKNKKHDKRRKPPTPLKPHHGSKVSKPGKHHHGASKTKAANPNQNAKPIVPFSPTSTLLLVGEGDFSFTNSLLTTPHISPATILTTSTNESEQSTTEKYPHSAETIQSVRDNGHRLFFNVDVTKKYPKGIKSKLYDAIIFNFPHVGGLSTHVDRQIRANQELLLAFMKNSIPLLAAEGTVVITLFEGVPYSQWNLRDLAKSCGLECLSSFKFDGGMYAGYKHMRTIGARDREGDWKGEERGARTYIFGIIGGGGRDGGSTSKSPKKPAKKNKEGPAKKGKAIYQSSDEDDEDDE
ncbi:hypothetical protein H072_6947 [Dactylellina haptotyla CBS 200.50]|uniref:25S rRNA (uridine-N(3))-methyltransferase BMT5-like domain-containing protein n=1 Tax=Dactylellina haptotyla (strain CBS 200.50) TaxID=1284197 RepID=S8ADZ0_DACHA|nr:hypothetical protein H072_6947 [Dactylellina haptotyla CBS 200.50]